ncbi:MAG: hypothetical protein IJX38_02225 [Clostridia bacterium]|nr:hypothetical protein [Clostridia bacterium]MBQ8371745.1 hypothetical protein [Clostridia bacterium]
MTALKKKIVLVSVAAALIILCFVLSIIRTGTVAAGSGNGDDFEVDSIEELIYVLDTFNGPGTIDTLMLSSYEENTEDGDADQPKHTSATVQINTNLSSKQTSNGSSEAGGIIESSQKVDRTLKIYFAEDCSYYESKGVYSSYSKYKSSDDKTHENSTFMKFDINIYADSEESYVLFNEFVLINDSESRVIKSAYAGEWIEVPYNFITSLIDIDSFNRETMNAIGEMMSYFIDEGKLEMSDESASFDEDDLDFVFDEIYDDCNLELDFEIDLSNAGVPKIYSFAKIDASETEDIGNGRLVTIDTDIRNEQNIVIKNIDNTEVSFNSGRVDNLAKDEESFDRYFNVDKVKEKDDD